MGKRDSRAGLSSDTVREFGEMCRKAGVKLTHQRLEIFREIVAAKDHPSVEDLHKRLKQRLPTISLDTVYRTLDTFERFGMVTKVPVSKGPARFEGKGDSHHHCVCARCRTIMNLTWPAADSIELPAETLQWGQINSRHIQLHGLCSACLTQMNGGKAAGA